MLRLHSLLTWSQFPWVMSWKKKVCIPLQILLSGIKNFRNFYRGLFEWLLTILGFCTYTRVDFKGSSMGNSNPWTPKVSKNPKTAITQKDLDGILFWHDKETNQRRKRIKRLKTMLSKSQKNLQLITQGNCVVLPMYLCKHN